MKWYAEIEKKIQVKYLMKLVKRKQKINIEKTEME